MYIQLNYNTTNNDYNIETDYNITPIRKNMKCCLCDYHKLDYKIIELNNVIKNYPFYGFQLNQLCNMMFYKLPLQPYNRQIMKINKDYNQVIKLYNKLPIDLWYLICSFANGKPKYDYLVKEIFMNSYWSEFLRYSHRFYYITPNNSRWTWKNPYIRYFCKGCSYLIEKNRCIYCNNIDNKTNINHICQECYNIIKKKEEPPPPRHCFTR